MEEEKNTIIAPQKKKRGRPKKVRTESELLKIENAKKNKKTLAERQAISLQRQKERQAKRAAMGQAEPSNKERFYCTNKELQAELIKWRDSNKAEETKRLAKGLEIDYTKRKMSEELGKMIIAIGQKVLNHSNFRNYSKELKEDMQGFFYYKIIKGLKTYNFEFNNPFAFFTQVAFNAYISIIGSHYKHINIKKDLMQKLLTEIQTCNGMSPSSALSKCIKNYLGDDTHV